jgi:hypothetical protein
MSDFAVRAAHAYARSLDGRPCGLCEWLTVRRARRAADRLALDCWRRLGIGGTYRLCSGGRGALLGWR